MPPREEYAGLAHCVVGSLGEARGVIEGLLGIESDERRR